MFDVKAGPMLIPGGRSGLSRVKIVLYWLVRVVMLLICFACNSWI